MRVETRELSDVESKGRLAGKRREEFAHELGVKISDAAGRKIDPDIGKAPPRYIDGGHDERLVHREYHRAVSFNAPAIAERLTEKPCPQLNGKSFRKVFCAGLQEVRESIGEQLPELLFLTGGVSRMEEIPRESIGQADRAPLSSVLPFNKGD